MSFDMLNKAFEERRTAQEALRDFYETIDTAEMSGDELEKEQRLSDAINEGQKRERRLLDQIKAERDMDEARADMPAFADAVGRGEHKETPEVSEYRQLDNFLRGKDGGRSFDVEKRDVNDLNAYVTTSDGSELVGTSMNSFIYELMVDASAFMQTGPTVLNTGSGEPLTIPIIDTYSTAGLVVEAAAIPLSAPTTTNITLNSYKYAFLVQVTRELLADSTFNVVDFVTRQGAAALGRGIDTALVTGSGSSQPNGIDLATVGTTLATLSTWTGPELIDHVHTVIGPSRQGSTWLINDTEIAKIRKILVATEANNYAWQPGLSAGQPDMLLGYPVVAEPNLSVGGANNILGVFGNTAGYFARFAGGFQIERSDEYAFNTVHATFRFLARVDGDIVDTVGIRTIKDAAA